MGELALDHLRHAALLEHDQDAARRVGQRPAVEIDELRRLEAERAELDAVFVDGGAAALHLLDEGNQRAAEGHHVGQVPLAENAGAHLEEIFRRGVGVVDPEAAPDRHKRMGQRGEESIGLDPRGLGMPPSIRLFRRAAQAVYPCCRSLLSRPRMHNFYAYPSYDL